MLSIERTCTTMCCICNCFAHLGVKKLKAIKKRYFSLNREEQDFYLNAVITPLKNDQVEYFLGSTLICRLAFKNVHSLGNSRLAHV